MSYTYPKRKLLYDIVEQLISSFLLIIVFVFLVDENSSSLMHLIRNLFLLFLAISTIGRMIETIFTKTRWDQEGIHIYTGVFSKSERFIPREKIENIQTSSTVAHKLFKVQKVTIETGENKNDLTLTFVPNDIFHFIQSYCLNDVAVEEEQTEEPSKTILFVPSKKDLVKASLMSLSFLALIPISFNLWEEFQLNRLIDIDFFALSLPLKITLIISAVILALMIGLVVTFNNYYNYEISMDDERIYVKKGVISTQTFSIRISKVQAVMFKQNPYQKLLGVTTVKLISTGDVADEEMKQINEIFPYLKTEQANKIAAILIPQFPFQPIETNSSTPKIKQLTFIRPPYLALVTLPLVWVHIYFSLLVLILFVMTYAARIAYAKRASLILSDHLIQITSGILFKKTIVTNRSKLIEITYKQSLLQKKYAAFDLIIINRAQPVEKTILRDVHINLLPTVNTWYENRTTDIFTH